MTSGNKNYIRQLGSDAIVYGIAGTINRFVVILLIPVYTRFFSPSDYGIWAVSLSLLMLLNQILTGLDNSAGRWFFDSSDLDYRKSIISSWFWAQMAFGGLLSLLIIMFAAPISQMIFNTTSLWMLILLTTLLAFISIFGKVLSIWLRFLRKPGLMLSYSIFSSVVTVSAILLFVAVWHLGVIGTFAAQLLAGIAIALITIVILRSWIDPRRYSTTKFKEMFVFSLPVLPATLAAWITSASDRFVMPFFMDSAEIGIYFLAFQVASLVGLIDAAFQMAWGPFAMSLINNPDSKQVYSRILSIYAFLGCWLCLVISLMAPVALPIIVTPEYSRAASCIPALTFFFLSIGLTNVAGIGAFIVKDSRPIAINIYIGAGVSTALLFALMPLIGKEGVALAKMIGMLTAVGYVYIASQRRCFIPYKFRDMAFSFAFAWLFIGISHVLPSMGWAALIIRVAMCLMFIPLGFWLGIIKSDQIRQSITFVKSRIGNLSA